MKVRLRPGFLNITSTCGIFLSFLTPAFGMQQFPIDKMKAFIAKKDSCIVAFGYEYGGNVTNPVFCVWNGTVGAGTISEFSGCMVGKYDAATADYAPLFPVGSNLVGGNKGNCTRDLVLRILFEQPSEDFTQFGSKRPLYFAVSAKDSLSKLVILHDPNGYVNSIPGEPKRKAKKINCDADEWSEDRQIQCSSPEELRSQVCNMSLSRENARARGAAYKKKTGKVMPTCASDADSEK